MGTPIGRMAGAFVHSEAGMEAVRSCDGQSSELGAAAGICARPISAETTGQSDSARIHAPASSYGAQDVTTDDTQGAYSAN